MDMGNSADTRRPERGRFPDTLSEYSAIGTLAMCSPLYRALADALRAFDALTVEELRVLQVCPTATFNGTR